MAQEQPRQRSGSILDSQISADDDGGKVICGVHIPKPMWVALVVSMVRQIQGDSRPRNVYPDVVPEPQRNG